MLVDVLGEGVRGKGRGGALALDLAAGEGGQEDDVQAQAQGDEGVQDAPDRGVGVRGGGGGGGAGEAGHAGDTREGGCSAGAGEALAEAAAGHHLGHHLHEGVLVEAVGRRGLAAGGAVGAAVKAEHHLAELVLGDGGFGARCLSGVGGLGLIVVF